MVVHLNMTSPDTDLKFSKGDTKLGKKRIKNYKEKKKKLRPCNSNNGHTFFFLCLGFKADK